MAELTKEDWKRIEKEATHFKKPDYRVNLGELIELFKKSRLNPKEIQALIEALAEEYGMFDLMEGLKTKRQYGNLVLHLLPYAGDGGDSEGAEECLVRLLKELQQFRDLKKAMQS